VKCYLYENTVKFPSIKNCFNAEIEVKKPELNRSTSLELLYSWYKWQSIKDHMSRYVWNIIIFCGKMKETTKKKLTELTL
jgi:hypothetical protein